LDSADKEVGAPTWLVSGFGDGALTDLARLCIRDFRHARVLDVVGDARDVGRRLMKFDRDGDPMLRAEQYLTEARGLPPQLDSARPPLYDDADFTPGADYRGQQRVTFDPPLGCVVVTSSAPHGDLEQVARGALKYFARRYESFNEAGGHSVDRSPAILPI